MRLRPFLVTTSISISLCGGGAAPLLATTYLVRPDGSGDLPTIQAAVDAASDGDVIELDDGTFTGAGNRNIIIDGTILTVRGLSGDPSVCILDLESEGRAFTFRGASVSVTLENLTIRNGAVTGADEFLLAPGGALAIWSGVHTVRNVVAENCRADYAELVFTLDSSIGFEGCTFRGGPDDEALYLIGGDLAFTECAFEDNAQEGIVAEGVTMLAFDRCRFERQGGYALDWFHGGGQLSILDSRFDANAGHVRAEDGQLTIERSRFRAGTGRHAIFAEFMAIDATELVVTGNDAEWSTVRLQNVSGSITGATISGNRCELGAGAIELTAASTVRLASSVLWGNCADDGPDEFWVDSGGSTAEVECTILDPAAIDGGGEVVHLSDPLPVDPMFCDPVPCEAAPTLDGDYVVLGTSPCLPQNNPCGRWIGAYRDVCGAVPVQATSWSELKSRFRGAR